MTDSSNFKWSGFVGRGQMTFRITGTREILKLSKLSINELSGEKDPSDDKCVIGPSHPTLQRDRSNQHQKCSIDYNLKKSIQEKSNFPAVTLV